MSRQFTLSQKDLSIHSTCCLYLRHQYIYSPSGVQVCLRGIRHCTGCDDMGFGRASIQNEQLEVYYEDYSLLHIDPYLKPDVRHYELPWLQRRHHSGAGDSLHLPSTQEIVHCSRFLLWSIDSFQDLSNNLQLCSLLLHRLWSWLDRPVRKSVLRYNIKERLLYLESYRLHLYDSVDFLRTHCRFLPYLWLWVLVWVIPLPLHKKGPSP